MDSWEIIILQWVNCLYNDKNDYIKKLKDLQDGQIYCKLIDKVKSWNYKKDICSRKNLVVQFLKDEYPKFVLNDEDNDNRNLYVATLILSRLSLEPIFQKLLCTNLHPHVQVKVKFILETIYSLGKNLTEEDVREIFIDLDDNNAKFAPKKPQYILKDFFNSPSAKSVNKDNIIHEQSIELRHLRACIETLRYEKSELAQDVKNQEKQIEDLQLKLQASITELKSLRSNTSDSRDFNCSDEVKEVEIVESPYLKEIRSLEDYVKDLQNNNFQLEEEKNSLTNKISVYKEKLQGIEKKNIINESMLESVLFKMEKKDEELNDLKFRYEELNNYLKERSRMSTVNYSFEVEDKFISELSLNTSERLSSVVEVQLQDTKKEMIVMQNKFKIIDKLLTILMEEYVKLKTKIELSTNNVKNMSVNEEKVALIQKGQENESELKATENLNLSLTYIFKNNSNKTSVPLFLDFLNKSDTYLYMKRLNKRISFTAHKQENTIDLLTTNNLPEKLPHCSMLKTLQFNINNNNLNYVNVNKCVQELYKMSWQENLNPQLFASFLVLIQVIGKRSKNDAFNYTLLETITQNHSIKPYSNKDVEPLHAKGLYASIIQQDDKFTNYILLLLQKIEKMVSHDLLKVPVKSDSNKDSKQVKIDIEISLSKSDLKSMELTWNSLREFISTDLSIYKVILLLEKSWNFKLQLLSNFINTDLNKEGKQCQLKKLNIKQNNIVKEITDIYFKNLQMLSFNLINSVQFVTMINKVCTEKLNIDFADTLSKINLKENTNINLDHQKYVSDKITNLHRKMNQFHRLIKKYEKENEAVNVLMNVPHNQEEKKPNILIESNKKLSEDFHSSTIDFQEDKENCFKNDVMKLSQASQFNQYLKEVHEKYEYKLNKMKEKMKAAYNSEIATMKKEQESTTMKKLEALQQKIEYQCYKHTEELKKYKKHISELTTQLWNVGEKLIIERQKKDDLVQKFDELKTRLENIDTQSSRCIGKKVENNNTSVAKSDLSINTSHSMDSTAISNMHCLESFKAMGNVFGTEDEEGEIFESTYHLADIQKSQRTSGTSDLDRLSILQTRNSKCKPHLKSSYPTELQSFSIPLTEDDIKSGNPDELFNDSLSQSLLTGKKVKRKDRARNASETPRRSRRFSNIFRKSRLTTERK